MCKYTHGLHFWTPANFRKVQLQHVEVKAVEAHAVDLALDVGHLPADLCLHAQLVLRQDRVLVVLLTQAHLHVTYETGFKF